MDGSVCLFDSLNASTSDVPCATDYDYAGSLEWSLQYGGIYHSPW